MNSHQTTKFDLDQAEKRAHILEGLIIASDQIDEVIAIIRASQTPDYRQGKSYRAFWTYRDTIKSYCGDAFAPVNRT